MSNVEHEAAPSVHPPPMPTDRIFIHDFCRGEILVGFGCHRRPRCALASPGRSVHGHAARVVFQLTRDDAMMPCVGAPVDDADTNHDHDVDDAQKNATALSVASVEQIVYIRASRLSALCWSSLLHVSGNYSSRWSRFSEPYAWLCAVCCVRWS